MKQKYNYLEAAYQHPTNGKQYALLAESGLSAYTGGGMQLAVVEKDGTVNYYDVEGSLDVGVKSSGPMTIVGLGTLHATRTNFSATLSINGQSSVEVAPIGLEDLRIQGFQKRPTQKMSDAFDTSRSGVAVANVEPPQPEPAPDSGIAAAPAFTPPRVG